MYFMTNHPFSYYVYVVPGCTGGSSPNCWLHLDGPCPPLSLAETRKSKKERDNIKPQVCVGGILTNVYYKKIEGEDI